MDCKRRPEVLLLFSGGRDSMLSAIRLIEAGYFVRMVSFDNGHMTESMLMGKTAKKLVDQLGADKCTFMCCFDIKPILYDLLQPYMISDTIKCPMCHCTCLACHSAMLLQGILLCREFGITYLATGDKKIDPYLIGSTPINQFYVELCKENGITLLHPVEDVKTNFERKVEIAEAGIHPKTYEPQCWLGYGAKHFPTEEEITGACDIFFREIVPKIKGRIGRRFSSQMEKDSD